MRCRRVLMKSGATSEATIAQTRALGTAFVASWRWPRDTVRALRIRRHGLVANADAGCGERDKTTRPAASGARVAEISSGA